MNAAVAGIRFHQVVKRYGSAKSPAAVDGISFTVPKGTLTTLLGPSGCGKTTTLRMIAGLESPSAGRIEVDGVDVTHQGPAERNVSMVFQSYALFPHMTVLDNVGYGLAPAKLRREQLVQRARAAMATVGLQGYDERHPGELSGGQQQRVALARALVLEPAVLLFDEPLSNLDARLRRSMREEIRGLQQRLKLTVAYVTHDQSEALAVSDQIIVMEAGRIAEAGTPRALYERPGSEFVAGFMGEAAVFSGEAREDGMVHVGPLQIRPREAPRPGAVRAAIRPQAWALAPGHGRTGGEGLAGVVAKQAYLGSYQELVVETGIGPIFVVSPDTAHHWAVGDPLTLSLNGHGVSVMQAHPPA
jgi:iron(III) transport system ATP-binding protein